MSKRNRYDKNVFFNYITRVVQLKTGSLSILNMKSAIITFVKVRLQLTVDVVLRKTRCLYVLQLCNEY